MCMSLAIKFAINFANNFCRKKLKKRNKPETKRDFLQEEDKDYCAFLLFIEDLYCFAVALEKRRERINLVIFAPLISVYYIPTISYTHQYSFRICQIKFLLTVCYKSWVFLLIIF